MPEWISAVTKDPIAALGVVCVILAVIVYRKLIPRETNSRSSSLLHLEPRITSLEKDLTDVRRRQKEQGETLSELTDAFKEHLATADQLRERFIKVETSMEFVKDSQDDIKQDNTELKARLRDNSIQLGEILKILERMSKKGEIARHE